MMIIITSRFARELELIQLHNDYAFHCAQKSYSPPPPTQLHNCTWFDELLHTYQCK